MQHKNIVFLLALSVFVGFSFQGSRGLYEPTEGRYAEAAREMVKTGNWLVPQLDYRPHWTKPPLTYWAIGAGIKLLGPNEWGVRFYNAVAFVFLCLSVAFLGTVMWNGTTGFVAGLISITSPFTVVAANLIHCDLLLSLWTAAIMLFYWTAYRRAGAEREDHWITLMWFFAGLGFLTKGFPLLVTFIILAVFHAYLKITGRPAPRVLTCPGVIVFLCIGCGWFFYVIHSRPELLRYYLHDELLNRIFTSQHGRNQEWYKPFLVYVPVLVFGTGLVSFVWPAALWKNRRSLRVTFLRLFFRQNEKAVFLVLWLCISVAVFSLSKSRLPLYVLPAFQAVVIATARLLVRMFHLAGRMRMVTATVIILAFVCIAGKAVGAYYYSTRHDMKPLYQECRKAMSGKTTVLFYNTRHNFGLQFYLGGKLVRVSDAPNENHVRTSLDSVIREIKDKPAFDTYVFVAATTNTNAGRLQSALDASSVPYRSIAVGWYYKIFISRPT